VGTSVNQDTVPVLATSSNPKPLTLNALGQTPWDVAGCEYIKDVVQPFSTVGTSVNQDTVQLLATSCNAIQRMQRGFTMRV